jgi:hypothetical protein
MLKLQRLEQEQKLLREVAVRGLWRIADRIDELTLPRRSLRCPICSRTKPRESFETRIDSCAFGGGRLERYLCAGCGCIFGPAKYLDLDEALVDLDYRLHYLDNVESDSTAREVRAFRALLPKVGVPYLNFGCGAWNSTIRVLRREGYDVWGYDPHNTTVRPFVVHSRDAISPVFGGLFSNNVIEHMVDPLEQFRYFGTILRTGSLMAHATPCYEYCYAYSRFHVVFFTGDSPLVLAERTGFRVVRRQEDGEFRLVVFEKI